MTSRPALSKARRALAGVMMAATLGTAGIATALAVGANSTTTSSSSDDTNSATGSGFTSTGSVGNSSGSVQTTTHGS